MLSDNFGAAPLIDIGLDAHGKPQAAAFVGRAIANVAERFPSTDSLRAALAGAALCCGLTAPEDIELCTAHDTYREYIVPIDGRGVNARNAASSNHPRWKKGGKFQRDHDRSAAAESTVRAPMCPGFVDRKDGSVFAVVCKPCTLFRQRNLGSIRSRTKKREADQLENPELQEQRTNPNSKVNNRFLSKEEIATKARKIAEQGNERALKMKDEEIRMLKTLLEKEKEESLPLRRSCDMKDTHSLANDDAATIFLDPEVQRMAEAEFAKGLHPVAKELWQAQHKYVNLRDSRGMRCDAPEPG